ncbi:MAG: UDP-glucose/GDP-mannose dehydrogenase family protein [Thiohalomonadales bacterium]
MNIVVVGTGYVGLVTGACLAEMGFNVTCVDNDKEKIEGLKQGKIPIYEPGLESIVSENVKAGRLGFVTLLGQAKTAEDTIFFIAVGTPSDEDGSADLSHVLTVARDIGKIIDHYSVIVNKSTVPVGTAEKVKRTIQEEIDERGKEIKFDVVSNPEFLKEGSAINDFMRPDRVIIGTDSKRARAILHEIYEPFTHNHERTIYMGIRDAELTKYAANAMLATKISFMNEIAALCDEIGVDVENIRLGIGADSRIGYSFIYPGCGYGGSCFPKDVKALIRTSEEHKFQPMVLRAVEDRNETQKHILFRKIIKKYGQDLTGLKFGVWGLAFKPGTDDMREASSVVLLKELIAAGATILAYDPVAMEEAKRILPADWFDHNHLSLMGDQYDALVDVDALILVTEWKPFRHPDFKRIHGLMKSPAIFDGRNQYDPGRLKEDGFEYYGIGRS